MNNFSSINPEGSQLRKHQYVMLDMLKYIDQICSKHQIPYYLSGGTLLGAVRHQGFIPWDDDLDIVLLKKDFKRLIKVLQKETSDDYVLHCNKTDSNYVAPFAKLRKKHTCIKEYGDNDLFYKYKGIYIDLFYLEPALSFFHYMSNHMQNFLVKCTHKKRDSFFSSFIYKLLYKCLFPLFSFTSYLLKRSNVSYPLGSFFKTQFKRKWYNKTEKLVFEGELFPCPKDYDATLKAQYGDYQIIPDLDKVEYHINAISFNSDVL